MVSMPCSAVTTAVRSMDDLSSGMSASAAATRQTTSRSGGMSTLSSVRTSSGTSAAEEAGRIEVRSPALSCTWMSSRELAEHPG
jgi:hypothetical protein